MGRLRQLGMAALLLCLTGCGVARGKKLAASEVDTFHQRFNSGRVEDIYLAASPNLQNSTSKFEFDRFVQSFRNKLGSCTASSQTNWAASAGSNGTVVTLTYDSHFERGEAKETFVFLVTDNLADLLGYHIDPAAAAAPWSEAEAQREAVRRYPELGVSGSRLNADFVARHQRYLRDNPAALRDPSWPLRLAEESAKAVN
jgi:hypothetical protein